MILIAPDSYKGTMSSTEVCSIIKRAFMKYFSENEITCFPIADGGEGTVDAMLSRGGQKITVTVTGPSFERVNAFYGILPDGTAVIEMACASGLPIVSEPKNPLFTTTYGTGLLIKDALDRGIRKFLIGLGGSGTNDAGIGCAAALGVRFLDSSNKSVPLCGAGLESIKSIDLSGIDSRIKDCSIDALCDVTSPLYGKNGAAYVFAPQKGASAETVKRLDSGLRNIAEVSYKLTGTDYASVPGSGAAGGLGFSLMCFLDASLKKGAYSILKALEFDRYAAESDLIITGEGCMDNQSILGKAPAVVASMSGNTPVIAIVGINKVTDFSVSKIKKIYQTDHGIRDFETVKKECRDDLKATSEAVAKEYFLKMQK